MAVQTASLCRFFFHEKYRQIEDVYILGKSVQVSIRRFNEVMPINGRGFFWREKSPNSPLSLRHTMNQAMKEKMEQIFVSALEIDSADDRNAFLDRACEGDVELRALVEDMIGWQPEIDRWFPEGGVRFVLTEDLSVIPSKLE